MNIQRFMSGLMLSYALLFVGNAFGNATPWVDIKVENGHLMMPTKVGSVEGYSMLDTGAQFSMINRNFIDAHSLELERGLPMRTIGVNGAQTRSTYRDIPVGLLGTEMIFQSATEVNWRDDTQLIIGADFLSLLIFQFDYPNQRMRAIKRDAIDLKKLKNVDSKKDKVSGQPMVKVTLNEEVDVWLVNDTGNSIGLVLNRAVASRRGWLEEFGTEPLLTRGINKISGMESFRLPVLGIGPYNVRNAKVAVPLKGEKFSFLGPERSRSMRRSKVQGILGYDVFKNFLMTIDYKTGAMHLEMPQKVEGVKDEQAEGEVSSSSGR